ncbi:MAG TPA: trypsin-like serine protease [Gaiellaceae bacterium]|nr:trypsin-like serine protease [Gaiellaceae bacterium]
MGGRLIRGVALATVLAGIVASAASSATSVVGGTPISVQSAPWTVFVASDIGPFEIDCTGSVIDATHVVTAGHCLFDDNGNRAQASAVTVTAGISNFQSTESTRQQRQVSSFRIHPGFVNTGMGAPDDVAVLTLASPLDLSGPAVRSVALPAANQSFPAGASVVAAGFGLEDGSSSTATGALNSMTATIDAQGDCGDFTGNDVVALDNAVIVCDVSPSSTFCQGDSGAGLVTTSGTPTLIGIVDASEVGCPVGKDGIDEWVGAPEILDFILGNQSPPTAPRATQFTTVGLRVGAVLVPGAPMHCATSGWPSGVQLSFEFVDSASGAVLQQGSSETYVVRQADVGKSIFCVALATNAGGTAVIETQATPTVGPTPRVQIASVAPSRGAPGRTASVRVVLHLPAGLFGTFIVCIAPAAKVAARRCLARQEQFGPALNLVFDVPLKIKAAAPLGPARMSVTAAAATSSAKRTATLRVTKP